MRDESGTPVTFSPEEARAIRQTLGTPGAKRVCPRCGNELAIDGPIPSVGSEGPHFHVTCTPCRRTAFITEVPGSRPD
jgi:hypothetical protein